MTTTQHADRTSNRTCRIAAQFGGWAPNGWRSRRSLFLSAFRSRVDGCFRFDQNGRWGVQLGGRGLRPPIVQV
ncbi:unnamed protein product [Vitrella brassicaformis CCMP3155]|uniref:Uncharacterized protein n=1 Tax=Vitrella brassicaformis (strain CCMP3155) TaxID=1169540 RepID=A0A0G4FY02_VITBC|nr:unnamed protein product [Vitrella brassicaformis CCMP3155]|eukprot:CEM20312.1 unnamed protein product [Vitrella brassicaformis CCMP3155]